MSNKEKLKAEAIKIAEAVNKGNIEEATKILEALQNETISFVTDSVSKNPVLLEALRLAGLDDQMLNNLVPITKIDTNSKK